MTRDPNSKRGAARSAWAHPARPQGQLLSLGPLAVPGLRGTRRVQVYLPPAPDPLPVAYLWDGQNVFGDEGSFAGGWGVDRVLSARARRCSAVPIAVAIDHGGEDRIPDYAPFGTERFGEGRAGALLDWVVHALKPRIDREFATLPGPADTMVGGSSMGGILSLVAFLKHGGVFGRALAMSPTLILDPAALLELIARSAVRPGGRLYLDYGRREGPPEELALFARVVQALEAKRLGREGLRVRIDPRGQHREQDWARRLPGALQFLFRKGARARRPRGR